MRVVIQRVSRAEVRVDGRVVGAIGHGLLLLVGLEDGDGELRLVRAARKIAGLRVFEDEDGKINRSLAEVGGRVLAVSQFTLAGSLERGRRPSFDRAMRAEDAGPLFERFIGLLKGEGLAVETGVFQALMEVELVNHGPVTFIWDDREGSA